MSEIKQNILNKQLPSMKNVNEYPLLHHSQQLSLAIRAAKSKFKKPGDFFIKITK
jgi:hypothetical protein